MNKKLTLLSIVLIIVGIIGSIGFSISSIPYLMDTVSSIEKEVTEESIIFNKEIDINSINVNTQNTDIILKKHNNNNVIVSQTGSKESFNYKIENIDSQLSIVQSELKIKNGYKSIKNLNHLKDYMVENIYSNEITVYVPSDVNIKVSTKEGTLRIEDDVLLNNVEFNTISGGLSIPKQVKELDTLNIKSQGMIRLAVLELLGIKDININSNHLEIYSNDDDIFIDNIESYIPENIKIVNNDNHYGNIYIDTDIPIANNLDINAYGYEVSIDFPIERYNINTSLKASDIIGLDNLIQNDIIDLNEYNNQEEIREFSKVFKGNLAQSSKEYKVNVKARYIQFD